MTVWTCFVYGGCSCVTGFSPLCKASNRMRSLVYADIIQEKKRD